MSVSRRDGWPGTGIGLVPEGPTFAGMDDIAVGSYCSGTGLYPGWPVPTVREIERPRQTLGPGGGRRCGLATRIRTASIERVRRELVGLLRVVVGLGVDDGGQAARLCPGRESRAADSLVVGARQV